MQCERCNRPRWPAVWWHDLRQWLCYPCYEQSDAKMIPMERPELERLRAENEQAAVLPLEACRHLASP